LCREELPIEDVGCDRLIVLAHGRRAESLPRASPQALLPHETRDLFLTDALARLVQVLPDARPAVALTNGRMRGANQHPQLPVAHDSS
jgi:hypothetical protein